MQFCTLEEAWGTNFTNNNFEFTNITPKNKIKKKYIEKKNNSFFKNKNNNYINNYSTELSSSYNYNNEDDTEDSEDNLDLSTENSINQRQRGRRSDR